MPHAVENFIMREYWVTFSPLRFGKSVVVSLLAGVSWRVRRCNDDDAFEALVVYSLLLPVAPHILTVDVKFL
jgi:hypothetical protein